MSRPYRIPLWKHAPFLRLLIPLIAGILTEEYFHLSFSIAAVFAISSTMLFFIFYLLPLQIRYKFGFMQGLLLNMVLLFAGSCISIRNDIRNQRQWFGHRYNDSSIITIRLTEPLTEKERSFKATAEILQIQNKEKTEKDCGKLLLYFSKKEKNLPQYGDELLIRAKADPIRNSGNPGAFDYERYMRFQNIFHQSFLKEGDYIILHHRHTNFLYRFIFHAQQLVVANLQQYIKGDPKVAGIAEALLIGYKEDLDKDLVQAYSNTGVVHIIAISGMHLGLIYIVLVWLFSRLPLIRKNTVARVLLILSCLWLFSLLTGASASVLRSAVMFTCIITGKSFFRETSIYNSLAASAFILLVYDPYLLWDVGFQLSYAALIGIVWLQKPIEKLFYFKNNLARKLWAACAVTLAAQVLTLPVCIYYFHQIPTIFLITNLACVPLSTVILFAEIFLLLAAFIKPVAVFSGKIIYLLTRLMNFIVDECNRLPFSLIDHVYATVFTTIFLYGFISFFCFAFLKKNKLLLKLSCGFMLIFISGWAYGVIRHSKQKKIIIYNVSRHSAVDFIDGNSFVFSGDPDFLGENALQNFHLKPARVLFLATERKAALASLSQSGSVWQFGNKKMMLIDTASNPEPLNKKIRVDILLIEKNAKCTITGLVSAVSPAVIVFDASNSLWKIEKWKKECEQLHLRFHITGKDGAFVTDAD